MKAIRKLLCMGGERRAPPEEGQEEAHHPPPLPRRPSLSDMQQGKGHRRRMVTGKAHRLAYKGDNFRLLDRIRKEGPDPLDPEGRLVESKIEKLNRTKLCLLVSKEEKVYS